MFGVITNKEELLCKQGGNLSVLFEASPKYFFIEICVDADETTGSFSNWVCIAAKCTKRNKGNVNVIVRGI